MSGAVEETFEWDSRIYAKGSVPVNGKPYWTYQSAAIWWMNESWRLGLLSNLGIDVQGQRTTSSTSGECPTTQDTKWLYWDSKKTGKWLDTGNDTTLTALGTGQYSVDTQ